MGGLSFIGALQLAFIVLKLTGVIDWSWWWVMSPALACVVAAFLMVLAVIGAAARKVRKESRS